MWSHSLVPPFVQLDASGPYGRVELVRCSSAIDASFYKYCVVDNLVSDSADSAAIFHLLIKHTTCNEQALSLSAQL
jgi:hypothetical protein